MPIRTAEASPDPDANLLLSRQLCFALHYHYWSLI